MPINEPPRWRWDTTGWDTTSSVPADYLHYRTARTIELEQLQAELARERRRTIQAKIETAKERTNHACRVNELLNEIKELRREIDILQAALFETLG